MELRVLRYFLTVARVGNFTRAAELLHITQPTLSRQLANLEERLGTQLLIRGKRKVSLTDAGRLLLQRAEEILTLSDKTEKEFEDLKNLVGGTIAIGSVEAMASKVLSELLKAFYDKYPQVSYHIFSGIGDDIKEKIDKGLLEVGILLEPVNIDEYDFIRLPQKERWGVLTKASSPLAQQESVSSKDLIGVPLLMSARPIVQNEIASWFANDYDDLHIISTFTLISNIISLVENGLGTAVCIEGALEIRGSKDICFRPFSPELQSGCVIVWKKHTIMSPTATRFIQFIKDALKAS